MNKLLRILFVAGLLGAVSLGIYHEVVRATDRRVVRDLQRLNADMQRRLDERQAMIERLGRTRRVAHLLVDDQRTDVDGRVIDTSLTFIELDDEGTELARQRFTIPGGVVYIDAWTVKFEQMRVAAGDPFAGHTLILLRRVFSEEMSPAEGFPIDTPGAVPPAYAASDHGRFEQQLWRHFWRIASDPEAARAMGVRVAQGEAVYQQVQSGQRFDYIVDAAGGVSLTPVATTDAGTSPWPELSSVDG